jgi:hypothetical protein
MTGRERFLAMGVVVLIILGAAALMGHQFILAPLNNRANALDALNKEVEAREKRVAEIYAEKPKLESWQKLSLPADVSLARLEYEKYLSGLVRQCGFAAGSFVVTPQPADTKTSPTLPGKKEPIYIRLPFTVQARGELADLVELLERFYRTPLMHQVKSIAVQRPLTSVGPQQRPNDLDINLTIEALVLSGAENRGQLLPGVDAKLVVTDVLTVLQNGSGGLPLVPGAVGPTGPLGPGLLAVPPRKYSGVAGKNIFFGPPTGDRTAENVEVMQFVYLTDITREDAKAEAFIYDRYNNRKTRLRASAGFDSFRILDSQGETLLRGTVLRIDDRDLVFQSGEKYYSIHVGQNLEEALKHPLGPSELKELGVKETTLKK